MASPYHDQGYDNGGYSQFGDHQATIAGRCPASTAVPRASGLVMLMVAAKASLLPLACTSCASDEDAVRYVIKRMMQLERLLQLQARELELD